MITKIQKWGDSLALRIPNTIAKKAGVEEGSAVDVAVQGNRLVVQPLVTVKYGIRDLISEIQEDVLHEEVAANDRDGREAW